MLNSIEYAKNSNDPKVIDHVHKMAHKEWASRGPDERFETLGALKASVGARRRVGASRVMPLVDIHAKALDNDTIVFETSRGVATPSNWAFSQACRHVGAPAGYLRTLDAPLASECFNHSVARKDSEIEVKPYLHLWDEEVKLAAITGPKYGRIYDAEVVELAERLVDINPQFYNPKEWSGKGSGLFASDHDVFIFLIDGGSMLDVGPRAKFNTGVVFRNSEVGDCTFEAWRFEFNEVCGNLFIWNPSNVSKLSIRHTQNGPARFFRDAWPTMSDMLHSDTTDIRDAVTLAIEHRIDDTQEAWIKLFQPKGFTKSEVAQAYVYAQKEEPNTASLWSAVQGFTALARDMEHADTRFDLAQRAAKLVEGLRN